MKVSNFWGKVNIHGANGCWIWTGFKNKGGYGTLNVRGRVWLAHRLSYLLASKKNPESLCVLHKCDNRSCVNPDHLFLGTIAENNQDMINKGRASFQTGTAIHVTGVKHGRYTKPGKTARGERNGSAKIKDSEVSAIRFFFNNGSLSQRLLSKAFGIHIATVNRIINRKTRIACQTK
jgi:hypothetical protein